MSDVRLLEFQIRSVTRAIFEAEARIERAQADIRRWAVDIARSQTDLVELRAALVAALVEEKS